VRRFLLVLVLSTTCFLVSVGPPPLVKLAVKPIAVDPEPVLPFKVYLPFVGRGPLVYNWKGAGDPVQTGHDKPLSQLNLDWWYDWGAFPDHVADVRYVPMLWCGNGSDATTLAALAAQYRSRVWLLFNEPDEPAQCGGSMGGETVSRAIATAAAYTIYYDAIHAADPTARTFCCGTYRNPLQDNYEPTGLLWWTTFLENVQRPIDGLALHLYPDSPSVWTTYCYPPVTSWQCAEHGFTDGLAWFNAQPKTAGKDVWVTETGYLSGSKAREWVRDNIMLPMLAWNRPAQVKALGWFSTRYEGWTWSSDLLELDGSMTPLGATWAQ
jgi:hypothetical protein